MSELALMHVSSLPPTECGIAEYTWELSRSLHESCPDLDQRYVRLATEPVDVTPSSAALTVNPSDGEAIGLASDFIHALPRKVVLLQHEFKLYGGPDGENVLHLLDAIHTPVVTTLHTVWPSFPATRHHIFMGVLQRSTAIVVFSEKAATIVKEVYGFDPSKVMVIPHGVPDVPFRVPEQVRWPGLPIGLLTFLSWGLMRPAKGIESVLAAMHELKKDIAEFTYVICGGDHPKRPEAKVYRQSLIASVEAMGLQQHVQFVYRYVSRAELVDIIQACDVGILPYTSKEQSSSGVLAWVLGCGRPVITTDFQYAAATVKPDMGFVVPSDDVGALVSAMKNMATDSPSRRRMMDACYKATRSWRWSEVAARYLEIACAAKSFCEPDSLPGTSRL